MQENHVTARAMKSLQLLNAALKGALVAVLLLAREAALEMLWQLVPLT